MVGHVVGPAAPNVGNQRIDAAPHGEIGGPATEPEGAVASHVPTPVVPPPHEEAQELGLTMSDPHVAERAQQLRDATLAETMAKAAPTAPATVVDSRSDGEPPRRGPTTGNTPDNSGFGRTLMLGGTTPADLLPKPKMDDVPNTIPEAPARPTDPSPLSMSVVAPSSWRGPQEGQPGEAPALAGTMAPDNLRDAPMGKPGSDKQTMFGMPAVDLAPPAREAPGLPSAMKTMLGVAIPGIAPTRQNAHDPPRPAGTLLGVAIPGIAPLHAGHPGQDRQRPTPQAFSPAQGAIPAPAHAPVVPAPAPLVMEPLPEGPQLHAKKGVPAIAVVGIVFVLVMLVGGGAAFLILRGGAPLTAQPQLDETGKESLKIRCESCPDGTVITLGASSTKVQGAAALLPLPAPLSIGENDLEIAIDRPAAGRDESVKIHVPVAYRVKADLSTLTSAPPSITVRVEALPGTEVTVDGKPTSLDASGKGSVALDVTAEVEGKSDEQKAIDRKIPFTVKPKGSAAPETGQLVVRAAVVPLHIDAPGLELYTDQPTAAISGQTKPGGTVTVDRQAVTVDAQGRFGVRVELPAEGEKSLTIVANAPPLAPRTVRAKVVRVASLEMAAKTLEAKAPLAFDAFGADAASNVGKLVVVDGEVLEIRVAQGYTVLLVEEKKACSAAGACVVRVLHGNQVKAARGDVVRIFGRVEGNVSSGGKTVPDIEASLVLVRAGAKKR